MARIFVLLIALAASLAAGCQRGPQLCRVEGVVSLDGEAVSEATVSFMPKNDASGSLFAVGTTDQSGRYTLTAVGDARFAGGTTPGEYVVTIVKRGGKPIRIHKMPEGSFPVYGYVVPEKYVHPDQSPLTAEVKPGKNKFDYDLTE